MNDSPLGFGVLSLMLTILSFLPIGIPNKLARIFKVSPAKVATTTVAIGTVDQVNAKRSANTIANEVVLGVSSGLLTEVIIQGVTDSDARVIDNSNSLPNAESIPEAMLPYHKQCQEKGGIVPASWQGTSLNDFGDRVLGHLNFEALSSLGANAGYLCLKQ